MSRDALKRSEHLRSVSQGPDEELQEIVDAAAAGPVPMASILEVAPTPSTAPYASGLTFEAIARRCARTIWKPNDETMLFFGAKEAVHGAEEFRTLRSRLYQLREKQPLRKILVTSALPKEGRSFVAANLAQVMARQFGCHALLIDADLRNPSLHSALGASAIPGLSECLLGEAEELDIIQRGQMENLFFIPCGRPVSGQTEIIANGRMKILLDRLGPLFDWIIVDSPAAMPVSDSGLIANFCDGVIIVVRSHATPFDIARKAREKFPEGRVVGVVLNGNLEESQPQIGYPRGFFEANPTLADTRD